MSNAMWFFANCHTFWTVVHFTCFVRTHDLTVWFFTFHVTNCVLWFLAWWVASWWFADRSTDCITFRVITFPATFGMAFQLLEFRL